MIALAEGGCDHGGADDSEGAVQAGTLVVSGGATLHGLCVALGATRLDVDGEIGPGIPTAILRGGAWEGQRIVAKSGGFGDTGFLARILG